MRSQRIEETTEANRVAAASALARGRVRAVGGPEGWGGPAEESWLTSLVGLLGGASPTAARSAVLAQVSERISRGLGIERVGIYLPEEAPEPTPTETAATAIPAAPRAAARFTLAASYSLPGAVARSGGERDVPATPGIELQPDDAAARRLLAGRSIRVFRSFPPHGRPAVSGPASPSGWSRVHATLQVPCPGSNGRLAALITLDGPSLATRGARELERKVETAARLLAGFLEREGLAREVAALRAERARAERLAALGRIASSAAHDLNNVLTVIVGHADLLALEWPGGAEPARETPAGEALEEIRLAADRGARIVEEVLAYGRPRPAAAGPVDLVAAIERLTGMLRRIAGDAIAFEVVLPRDLPPVSLDLERFERVLVNLVVNARHAIEARRGVSGRIEIQLERVCAEEASRTAGDGVRLRVRDDGCGMDEATRRRVFEPFFTTRAAEGGTGLGLADVADFARTSGAVLTLASAPGAGCAIELLFPVP